MADELPFRITAILLVVGAISTSAYFRRKANRAGGSIQPQESRKMLLGLRVTALCGIGGVLAYVVYPASVRWFALVLPVELRWAGAALSASMISLLYWMFRTLGRNITPTVVTRKEHTLIVSGPYRWIRHPLYTFGTVFWIGISLLIATWWLPLWLGVGISLLVRRTTAEEENLLKRFGDDYRQYMRRTGRFFPRLLARRPDS